MAIAAILGIAQAGLSIAGGLNKDGPSSAGSVYSNLLSRRKTQLMNQVRLRAYKRQLGRVKEQYKNNFTAANTAYQQEQARFNEQLMEFAFQKESQTRQLLDVAGVSAAGEQQGRSAERAAAIQVLGDYGRGQAIMAENLASAYRQGGRNMARIAGQNMAADMSAYGSILEGPIPEMAQQEYTPPAPQMGGLNLALTIGQGIMSGIKTYGMAGGDFGGAASETSTPDDAGPNS
jgi:hypothetical protein